MTTKQMGCDDQRLLDMLREELPEADSESLLDHVESCQHCRQRLEELTASQDDWRKAADVLSESPPEPERSPHLVLGSPSDHHAKWTESMARQLLSPPSHPEMLGSIGRYEVEELIGAGGMGVVFKAFDSSLNRTAAIKVLAPYLAGNGPARQRFAREARAAAAVVHQHVVPIHNVETDHETPFLVMHYVAGESLQSRVDREGALQLREILRIGMQVASGLAAAHQQGLVHRDIKPSNILLEDDKSERALITDFGLARAADDATVTRTGAHLGTPQYMSPEQAHGDSVDQQSDLFSLGSVLYTLCTGRPPFRAETPYGIIRRIAEEEPRPIRELNSDVPEWLCELVEKLMSKRKEDRFASASEVRELLEGCLRHVQQPDTNPLPAILTRPRPAAMGHLRTAILTLLVGFVLLVAGIVYYIQTDHGVVKIDVRDPSLDVSIAGQTVTMRDGNKEPLTITAGEQALIVQQGKTKFETKSFRVRRGDEGIAFEVELLDGKIVVRKNEEPFESFPIPMGTSNEENSKKEPTVAAVGPVQDSTATKSPSPSEKRRTRPTGTLLGVVERIAAQTVVDDCRLSGRFTRDSAVLALNNTTDEPKQVTFNYQIAAYDTREFGAPPEMMILRSGEIDLSLAPKQSHNEVLDLGFAPDLTLPKDHKKDVALIRVSKGILPLSLSFPYANPAPHLARIGGGTHTISVWEFKDRMPFPATRDASSDVNESGPFVKVMSAPVETERDRYSGAHEVAISDDRRFLIAGYYGSQMRLWNVETGKATSPPVGLIGDCTQLGFVPDSSTAWIMDYGGTLRLWNAETGELIRNDAGPSRGEDSGMAPIFSPDGKIMVSANRPGNLEFWNLQTNEEIALHKTSVSRMKFSRDGKFCFTYKKVDALNGYGLFVWDPQSGKQLAGPFPDSRVTGSSWGVYGAGSRNGIYSEKESQLFTFENDREQGTTEMVVRSTIEKEWPVVRRVRLSFRAFHVHWLDDKHLLVDGLRDGEGRNAPRALYQVPINASDESTVKKVSPKRFSPRRFVLDRKHSRWLNVTTRSVTCWKFGEEQPVWSKNIPELSWRVRGVIGSEDWILVHDLGGSAFVFDLNDGTELWRKPKIRWADAKGSFVVVGDKTGAEVWKFQSPDKPDPPRTAEQQTPAQQKTPVRPHKISLSLPPISWPEMSVSPDQRKIVAPSRKDRKVAMWDIGTGKQEFVFKGTHSWQISDIVFSPDGSFLVTASSDKTAILWNAKTGDQLAVLEGHDDRLKFAKFSPSGKYIFTASGINKCTGRIWNGRTGEPISVLGDHTDVIELAQFSKDEKQILTGAKDATARLWDVATGEAIHVFRHGSTIASVDFGPDQNRILTASSGLKSTYVTSAESGARLTEMGGGTSNEHSVRVWDTKTGQQLVRLDQPAGIKAAFVADGKQIVTAGGKAITWWDATTGEKLSSLPCENAIPWNTRFSPDRRYVIVIDIRKSAKMWDLKERKLACEILTGESLEDQFSIESDMFYSLSRRGILRGWPLADDVPLEPENAPKPLKSE